MLAGAYSRRQPPFLRIDLKTPLIKNYSPWAGFLDIPLSLPVYSLSLSKYPRGRCWGIPRNPAQPKVLRFVDTLHDSCVV